MKGLHFGTGGIRAIMGEGEGQMNLRVVRFATQGLANTIKKGSVFIGYDVRHNSREFALEAARVLAGNGIKPLLSKDICPTPLVSFACRHFGCAAAIMITASHNPKEYNGYKVYGSDGGQIVPPLDRQIIAEVNKIRSDADVKMGDAITYVGEELDALYLAAIKPLQKLPAQPIDVLYSNLHGVGIRLMEKALRSWGYGLHYVEAQKVPDGNFPNAPSPNPEDIKAMQLGMNQVKELFIASDPDADRVGVAIPGYRFSGNQIAVLLLDHLLSTRGNGLVVKSLVTTELFRKVAEKRGARCLDVFTGFKYVAQEIAKHEKEFLFGAEESLGYLHGTYARDKDAISSACLIVEMAAHLKGQGKTLLTRLNELYQEFGTYREELLTLTLEDLNAFMTRLRKNPPALPIASTTDYLPESNMIRYMLTDGTKLIVRPSGTEPKIKIYIEAVDKPASYFDGISDTLRAFERS